MSPKKKAAHAYCTNPECPCVLLPIPASTREQKASERLKRAAIRYEDEYDDELGIPPATLVELEEAAIAYARAVAAKEKK